MKKWNEKAVFLVLLSAMSLVSFMSCSKDDDDASEYQIIGTWEAVQVEIGGEWVSIPSYSRYSMSMTFHEDGTYYGRSDVFGTGYGTYKIIGNSIKTYVDGDYMYTYRIIYKDDETAEVLMVDEEGNDFSLHIRLRKSD